MVKAAEDKYSVLPGLTAVVSADTVDVDNPASVACAVGGTSVPMVISVAQAPFNDVSVSLGATPLADDAAEDAADPSAGLTAPEAVAFDKDTTMGLMTVGCAADMEVGATATLDYALAGTDVAVYALSAA